MRAPEELRFMLATRHDPLDAARSWFRYRRLLAGLLQPELRRVPSKRKPRSLYAKLGAHSRAGAPERARALGLLAPSARQR